MVIRPTVAGINSLSFNLCWLATVGPLFREHPRDLSECRLNRGVPRMEVGLRFVDK